MWRARWYEDCLLEGEMKGSNYFRSLNPLRRMTRGPERAGWEQNPSRRRLAEAYDCLQQLDRLREDQCAPALGKILEERIVWRELLDLELQEIDEQIERISEMPADGML